MKAVLKNAAKIIAVIICVLLITTLVLGLIRIRPLNNIGEYNRVQVLTSYDTQQHENEGVINDAISSVKFSVLRSMYELNADFGIKPVTKTITNDDGDEEETEVYLTAAQFEGITTQNGEFMLKFSYGQAQQNKHFALLNGDQIAYDSLILIISKTSDKKLTQVKMYPYMDGNIGNTSDVDKFDDNWFIGSVYYNVYEFTAKMHTYDMYEILANEFEAGRYSSNTDTE